MTDVYPIADAEAKNGDILIYDKEQGFIRARAAYDQYLFGILQTNAILIFRKVDSQDQPIARQGTAYVNISNLNGSIKSGDYITSSPIKGVGQKASQSGYIIGIALTSFTAEQGQEADFQGRKVSVGQIPVALRIGYSELTTARSVNRLLEYFNAILFRNLQDPEKYVQVLRYIGASMVVLFAFLIGFITFSRSVPKSIEAIGRNPLASKAIIFSIILNIGFTLISGSIGIIAALIILRF